MKRSKVIDELYSILRDYTVSPTTYHIPDAKELATRLVDKVEELGMLPPFGSRIKETNIVDRWGLDTGKTQYVRVIENLWEEESDGKQ